MTREEFAKLAAAMKTYYPRDNVLPTKESMSLWYDMLQDLGYQEASVALRTHVSLSSFPPSVADIRKTAADNRNLNIQSMDEAWGDVLRAIRRYGYPREVEALESLQEPCRTIVRRIGWQNLCLSEKLEIERAFFRDSYNPTVARFRAESALPAGVKGERQELLDEKIRDLAELLPRVN